MPTGNFSSNLNQSNGVDDRAQNTGRKDEKTGHDLQLGNVNFSRKIDIGSFNFSINVSWGILQLESTVKKSYVLILRCHALLLVNFLFVANIYGEEHYFCRTLM